jgi:hypothetical protein
MSFEIYHQLGFRYPWNLQSIKDDGTGDGVIVAPRSMEREKVEQLDTATRQRAIFDPQFFLPATPKGELATYPFFPNLTADGFTTSEYAEGSAEASATACVDFQITNDFRYVVIPTRHFPGTPSDFIENQEHLFVAPFTQAIAAQQASPPVLLQLVLNENMLKDAEYAADLLNWVTGFSGITGIYLITETAATTKQIKDPDFLYRLLSFCAALRANQLDVVLGYLNTEAVLLCLADPQIVTMGAYENTRSFRIGTFVDEKKRQQGPNPRLYVSRALQWIDRNYHGAIIQMLPDGLSLFDQNKYQALMFTPSYKWHFTKPELYKHHFLEFSKQLRYLASLEGADRYQCVQAMLKSAMAVYKKMDEAGIVFDVNNDGAHLPAWLTAANCFAKDRGWS